MADDDYQPRAAGQLVAGGWIKYLWTSINFAYFKGCLLTYLGYYMVINLMTINLVKFFNGKKSLCCKQGKHTIKQKKIFQASFHWRLTEVASRIRAPCFASAFPFESCASFVLKQGIM